jgi:hypothetical protein
MFAAGVTGAVELSFAVDSVNGSGPGLFAACRNNSPPDAVPDVPPERVRTTPSTTPATTTPVINAIRGADFHQGWSGPPP